jgi:hypothetical protein
VIRDPRFGETRKAFLHIGQKDWNASIGKSLSKNFQHNGFTSACYACNQIMLIRHISGRGLALQRIRHRRRQ